jgi:tetratricopeptide (TPR) repeat protein
VKKRWIGWVVLIGVVVASVAVAQSLPEKQPQEEEPLPAINETEPPGAPKPHVYYDLIVTKVSLLINDGELNQAEETLQTLMEHFPNDSKAHYYLGVIKERQGDGVSSEKAYQKAVDLDPQHVTAYLALAAFYSNQKAFSKSLEWLLRAEKIDPTNGVILFHQGRAYQGLRQDEMAAPRLVRAALLSPSLLVEAHYYAGQSFKHIGFYEDAEEAFNTVIMNAPASPLALSAQALLKDMKVSKRRERRWNLLILSTVQFDDNVVLEPSDGPAQTGEPHEDTRLVLNIQGDFALKKRTPWITGLAYSLYQSLHNRLSRFNTLSHTPQLYLIRKKGSQETRLDYLYQSVLLDGAHYLETESLRSSYQYRPRPGLSSDFFYQAEWKNFEPRPNILVNSMRDAQNNAIGATASLLLGPVLTKAGYRFELENAENADWDFKGHRLILGAAWQMPQRLQASLTGDYSLNDYSHPNSFSIEGIAREDSVSNVSFRLARPFTPLSGISMNYTLTRNDSNLALFDYKRQIYSVQSGWRF